MLTAAVDSYRFMDRVTARIMRSWTGLSAPVDVPWTPLAKPLDRCTVAIVCSAGLAISTDPPFNLDIERDDPWGSDPSFRVIPRDTAADAVTVSHLHINPTFAEQDVNCVLPLRSLIQLEGDGVIGRTALSHYSYIGYTLRPERLLSESVPAIIAALRAEQVDVVLLVPV